jgi:hypothetical protein
LGFLVLGDFSAYPLKIFPRSVATLWPVPEVSRPKTRQGQEEVVV